MIAACILGHRQYSSVRARGLFTKDPRRLPEGSVFGRVVWTRRLRGLGGAVFVWSALEGPAPSGVGADSDGAE